MKNGLESKTMIKHRLRIFGNSLIHVPVPSIFNSFVNEILKPFFVFQIFSIILWCTEVYYWYSIAIFVIMCVTMTVNIYYLQTNLKKIRAIAQHTCIVEVLREGQRSAISSENLVPGDIVYVTKDLIFPCDLVILNGYCLVDETMLTGESQPVMKESLPEIKMIYNREKLHTLSAGTRAVLFGDETIGLVMATGFKTAKGELVRSILFPTPNRFKFDRDSLYFVGIMGLMALIGFFIAIEPLRKGGYMPGDIVKKLLDLITISVPPALPLTMTIGIGYSMGRLGDHKISCIRPPAVSSSGRVSVICFDKTGTLTQDKMSLNTVYDATLVSEKNNLKECDAEFQKMHGSLSFTYFDR